MTATPPRTLPPAVPIGAHALTPPPLPSVAECARCLETRAATLSTHCGFPPSPPHKSAKRTKKPRRLLPQKKSSEASAKHQKKVQKKTSNRAADAVQG